MFFFWKVDLGVLLGNWKPCRMWLPDSCKVWSIFDCRAVITRCFWRSCFERCDLMRYDTIIWKGLWRNGMWLWHSWHRCQVVMVVMEGIVEKVATARAKAKAKPELHVEVTNGFGSSFEEFSFGLDVSVFQQHQKLREHQGSERLLEVGSS